MNRFWRNFGYGMSSVLCLFPPSAQYRFLRRRAEYGLPAANTNPNECIASDWVTIGNDLSKVIEEKKPALDAEVAAVLIEN